MDYFCYISRAKIDQLFHQVESGSGEWTERSSKESALEAKGNLPLANIMHLFDLGITYGRKGVIQREHTVKLQYVQKLQRVLGELFARALVEFLDAAERTERFDAIYYQYKGLFSIQKPFTRDSAFDAAQAPRSSTIVTLMSKTPASLLHLDCSLSNFSEGIQPDGSFEFHSGNWRFFSGELSLFLETVFILLNRSGYRVVGTPLFLRLTPDNEYNPIVPMGL
jgi:hypothetical protein